MKELLRFLYVYNQSIFPSEGSLTIGFGTTFKPLSEYCGAVDQFTLILEQ